MREVEYTVDPPRWHHIYSPYFLSNNSYISFPYDEQVLLHWENLVTKAYQLGIYQPGSKHVTLEILSLPGKAKDWILGLYLDFSNFLWWRLKTVIPYFELMV